MTPEELTSAIKQMKAEGLDDNKIIGANFKMFQNGELTLEQFEAIIDQMGYHLSDEFKAMDPEAQKKMQWDMEAGSEDDGEKAPKELSEEEGTEPEEAPEGGTQDDDDEEKKAMKLFGADK